MCSIILLNVIEIEFVPNEFQLENITVCIFKHFHMRTRSSDTFRHIHTHIEPLPLCIASALGFRWSRMRTWKQQFVIVFSSSSFCVCEWCTSVGLKFSLKIEYCFGFRKWKCLEFRWEWDKAHENVFHFGCIFSIAEHGITVNLFKISSLCTMAAVPVFPNWLEFAAEIHCPT